MIQLPITAFLTVDVSKRVFMMAVEQKEETYCLKLDTVVNATIYDVPKYDGEYTVSPQAYDPVILETKDKLCEDDITVLKVPTRETTNEYGTTFYIAEV